MVANAAKTASQHLKRKNMYILIRMYVKRVCIEGQRRRKEIKSSDRGEDKERGLMINHDLEGHTEDEEKPSSNMVYNELGFHNYISGMPTILLNS